MTLPAPDYQLPWTCDHCGYVGDTGPTHYHPRAAVGHLCPKPATGGQRYYSESTVREVVSKRIGGDCMTTTDKILVPALDAAKLLSMGRSTFWREVAKGTIPAPVKIGGLTRWRVQDLQASVSKMGHGITWR